MLTFACSQGGPASNVPRPSSGPDEDVGRGTQDEGPAVILPNGTVIRVEVSADDATRQQGLMFRESVPPGHGMLFIFPERAAHSFWMKNTLIPLDMIWIDDAKRIVHIRRDVPPCRADPCPGYGSSAPARFVLEVAGGQAAVHRLNVGDQLMFRNIDETAR